MFIPTVSDDGEEQQQDNELETTKKSCLIARRCTGSEICDAVETPGVKLLVAQGLVSVTIQKVNSSRSGLYKVRAFFGKYMFEVDATLVVNEASFSSTTAPPHSCTPKHPNSSHLLWLYVLIPAVILLVVYFCKHKKAKM
ncbi:hypothetical protein ABG768_016747 [Culter alburnus]|uniref:Uncharacterized protein n=1 Tax=Culter alburnus TaxID=194366 RepID=A0AAW1Z1X2_CULAL